MTLRDVVFPSTDEDLRRDVHVLGDLVGAVLREQGGTELFERVEAARTAAIRRREGSEEATAALKEAVEGLRESLSTEIVRAFSTYFQVVNLAERVHRVRRGRAWMIADRAPQPGSLADTVEELRRRGLDGDRIAELFRSSRVEPVFTAHPTEATRRIILEKQERIASELIARLAPERTPHEERSSLARIREDITAAWQTEEHPSARPTVADEREHVLYYVANVLYQVLPALHERLEEALGAVGITPPFETPALVRPGSWVGGDMDGNPNVDADTVRTTLARHRALVVERYTSEVRTLARTLSQSSTRVSWSPALDARTAEYRTLVPEAAARIPERHAGMGYRIFLELVAARLEATGAEREAGYEGPDGFAGDVALVLDSLTRHGGAHAGAFRVRRLLRRVRAFGFHLAVLDVRQDARELRDVVAELFDDPEWASRPPSERASILRDALTGRAPRGTNRAPSDRVLRALDVFEAIEDARTRHGPDAIGSYIMSMARDVDDALTVLWLATRAGIAVEGDVRLDVTPLFETVPDLERAEAVLDDLFTDPVFAPHLARRGRRMTVMVGYSDSNKDGGIASARWALQKALEGMARAAERHGVTLTVFHGRGGTVSRGGGQVHRAVAAMPARSIGGRLRLTEQGEVIDAKYGLPPIALRELERMLGSIAVRSAEDDAPPPAGRRALAETVATRAREAFRSLVYEDEAFTPYFRAGTPIDVIERMPIGSRPASRRSGTGVEDLRAIPWVFSWTQCRAMLTGWYGLGTGLEAARDAYGIDALREAAAGWSFFDALLADVEMVLAKADIQIAAGYAPLAPPESRGVFDAVRAEFDRTVSALLEIRETTSLLESDPTLQRSIRLRNPYVDPMNVMQVDLLGRWRAAGSRDGPLLTALLATVNGIARGLQNTG